ncbi:MAG: MBL fold metallo-hydrolase [Planctomycetes bacterium]|nr:MBL fold metallo-hydrolase [Planctomycetota bacterium]
MKLTFRGAVRTVTGSLHEVEAQGRRYLVDCGLYQGRRAEARRRNEGFAFDPRSIDGVLLTHAHMDHAGRLPTLVRAGFDGPIWATAATRDLAAVMLRDSARIQESDAAYWNRKHPDEPIEPLYRAADAEAAVGRLAGVPYGRWFDLAGGVRALFLDAGHILGSAQVLVEVRSGALAAPRRVLYTGDLGRRDVPILRDPETAPVPVDALVMESTYGDRLHPRGEDMQRALAEAVGRAAERRGVVVVPAFSVGRTQRLVYHLHRLIDDHVLPPMDVVVDSPLSTDVTEIHRLHSECFDEEARGWLERGGDPFGFARLRYTRTSDESKALNARQGPLVIISASGMCESGRILHHLRQRLPDGRNLVLLVGYQAAGTLGRRLQEGASEVRIFGETVGVRAQVETVSGVSAHADRLGLEAHARSHRSGLGAVYVVHGEEDASLALARRLSADGLPGVMVPEEGRAYEL